MKVGYLIVAGFFGQVFCSPGDQLDEFIDCTCACEYNRRCAGSGINYIDPQTNEFHSTDFVALIDREKSWLDSVVSRLTFWDCLSECDYTCQQIITEDRVRRGEEILQFHGKWPFRKVWGVQEFFASAFSVGNFVSQYRGYRLIRRRLAATRPQQRGASSPSIDKYYERMLLQSYLAVSVMGMLAWLSSTVFHFRDLLVTEKLDYFFAGGTVLTGFHAILSRVVYRKLQLQPRQRPQCSKRTALQLVRYATLAIFACHLLRLYLDWSYTYNMRFNICFGVLQYVILVYVALDNRREAKSKSETRRLVYQPIALVVFTALAMSLELFDFFSAALQIDAHATWHLLTIVPGYYLFDFFLYDLDFTLHRKTV